jgi:hypothetical protein
VLVRKQKDQSDICGYCIIPTGLVACYRRGRAGQQSVPQDHGRWINSTGVINSIRDCDEWFRGRYMDSDASQNTEARAAMLKHTIRRFQLVGFLTLQMFGY